MNRRIIITASVFGTLGVVAGAFAAHGLKPYLSPQQFEVWHTGVQYQFYHVFALLFISGLTNLNKRFINAAYYLFSFGILLFSGSLYLLACRDLIGGNWTKMIGPVTPLGGVLFIAGWATLAIAALKINNNHA